MARTRKNQDQSAQKETGLTKIAEAVATQDIHELTAPAEAPPAPVPPEVGDVVQVVAEKNKYIARVAIVYRADQSSLLCYQPSGTSKPPSFTVKPNEVAVIGKAKLKWKREL